MKYDNKQISYELFRTAMGEAYYGNALRVALDFDITPDEKTVLNKFLRGSDTYKDGFALQDLAIKIYHL